jgi:soluble lytic murein transglycosylase-like protein
MRFLGLLFFSATCGLAGEWALLSNGTRLPVDRHETEGSVTRLYTGSGCIELSAGQVLGFETEGEKPPAPPVREEVPPAQPEAPSVLSPGELADAAADKYGLPRKLVRSVMAAESAFQPHAVSPKGAIGLMQLMPDTARDLGANPHDPVQNVDAGTRYLRDLLIKYNGLLWHALAAYNAGPGAVDKYRGLPPYRETLQYVNRIHEAYNKN